MTLAMNLVTMLPMGFLSGGGDASTISGILKMATEIVTWLITTMTAYLTFVTSNPVILIMALIMLAGLGVGMLMRIWHSVG